MSGPSWVDASVLGPTCSRDIASASRVANCCHRVVDVEAVGRGAGPPPLRILATIAPETAASRSASANTRNGALPPSSIEQFTIRSAAPCSRVRPTAVDPVNDS
jgi:hypothetical protein